MLAALLTALNSLDTAIAEVEAQMAARLPLTEGAKLTQIDGVSMVAACGFVAFVGSAHRWKNWSKVWCGTGLDPARPQSGPVDGGCRMPRQLLSGSGGCRGLGDKMAGEMTVMDIAGMWRSMRADPAEAPRPGAHQQVAGEGITIAVTPQCQATLPLAGFTVDEVTVTVTSHRPGVAAQVSIGANLNSLDGSYQGPTTTVGHGQFTAATRSRVRAGFAVLPSGWPVLGVGAEAVWEDGAPHSIALVYEQLACDPWVWWRWPIRILDLLTRPFLAGISSLPPRSSKS
jgi:hypothetical protein